MRNYKGFTLIELLVVIAIIALLLSIMLPALRTAKEQGRMLVCRSNLKNVTLGALLWAEDNDGWAIAGDWYKPYGQNQTESSMCPYLDASEGAKGREKSVFTCPGVRESDFYQVDPSYSTNSRLFTYAANGYMTLNMTPYGEGSPGTKGPATGSIYGDRSIYWDQHGVTKLSAIKVPYQTVYFLDHEYYAAFSWTFNPHRKPEDFPDTYRYGTRWHKKKPGDMYGIGNMGWVDGHVSVEPKDFEDKNDDGGSTRYRWKDYFYDQ